MSEVPDRLADLPDALQTGLRNYWYPILLSEAIRPGRPLATRVLGENLVVWRDEHGQPAVLFDRCAHRAAKLSLGRVVEGQIQCAFHNYRFDGSGRCVFIPDEQTESPPLQTLVVRSYPAQDFAGYLWAYMHDGSTPAPPLPEELPAELSDVDGVSTVTLPPLVRNANWIVGASSIDGTPEDGPSQLEIGPFVLPSITVARLALDHTEPVRIYTWHVPVDGQRTTVQRLLMRCKLSGSNSEGWNRLVEEEVRPRLDAAWHVDVAQGPDEDRLEAIKRRVCDAYASATTGRRVAPVYDRSASSG